MDPNSIQNQREFFQNLAKRESSFYIIMLGQILPNKQKIKQLGLDVFQHPPYSPDLASTDYHLFCTLSNKM